MDRDVELALVGRLRAGDGAAFDAVHAAFNVRLFTFLLRLSRRRDVAEACWRSGRPGRSGASWMRYFAEPIEISPLHVAVLRWWN